MKLNLKQALLAGSAIVAVSAFGIGAQAATITPVVDTTLSTNTGDAGGAQAGDAAGNNGTDSVDFGAATITITNPSGATQTGGAGSTGGADANSNGGNAGGVGGDGVDFNDQNGSSTSSRPTLVNNGTSIGGAGGAGGVGNASVGGTGGAGGVGVRNDATFGRITGSGNATGGAGGVGGAGNGTNMAGGTGGAGGAATILSDDSITLNTTGNRTGGAGGGGGTSTGNANNSTGGAGGNAITVSGTTTGDTITIGDDAIVSGGAGGAAGTAGGGTAGAIGAGGIGIAFTGGTGTTLTNDGIIVGGAGTAGTSGTAVNIASGTVAHITNTGRIGGNGTGGQFAQTGTGLNVANGATLTTLTNTGGDILTTSGTAVNIAGSGVITTLDNTNGLIQSLTGAGVVVGGTGNIGTLTNTDGTITTASTGDAAAAFVLNSTGQGAITNAGTISNTRTADNAGVALAITAAPTAAFTNSGTITSGGTGSSGVAGVAIDYAAAATVINSGTINGQITDTVAVATTTTNSGTINGAITLNGAAAHTINNFVTASGTTTSGTIVGNITGGSAVDTLNVNGGTITGTTDLAAGTNVLAVTGDFTTGGTILATGGDINTTTANAGTVFTVNNNINLGAGTIGVGAGSTIYANTGNITTTGALTNNATGAVQVGIGHLITVASQNAAGTGANSTGYIFNVSSDSDAGATLGTAATAGYGRLVTTAAGVNLANTNVRANVVTAGFLATGNQLQIAHGSTTPVLLTPGTVADNSFIYSFALAAGGGANEGTANDAVLIVTRAAPASIGSNGNNDNIATALAANGNGGLGGDSQFNSVQAGFGNAATQDDANEALSALAPTVDGGAVTVATSVSDTSFELADQQLAMLRSDQTGMAAGNMASGLRTWFQGFGSHNDQKERGGDTGYQANTYGGALGVDTQNMMEDSVLGLSFTYGRSYVHSKNANRTRTDVDSYQLTAYGSHYLDKGTFIDGMVAGGYGDNDQKRHDVGGVGGLDADADYDSWQGAAKVEAGRDIFFRGMTLTPTVGADYFHYYSESYSEDGAGGAGLDVGHSSENILNLGVGLQATATFKNDNGSYFKPDIHTSYKYDVLHDDKVDVTSNFIAGGPDFRTNGLNPSNHTLDAGVDLRFYTTNNWEFLGSYDFTYKPEYHAHSGVLRAAYKF